MAREYGSGSMREKRPGVWELRVAGRSRTVRGTRKQANAELARMVVQFAGARRPTDAIPTLRELIDEWLPAADLEASTRDTYLTALAHLPASIARTKVTHLRLRDFDRAYAELAAAGVSAHQVRKLHTVVCAALREAVRWELVAQHPARGARLPKLPARTVQPPAVSNLERLLAVAAAHDLQAGVWIRLALASGARRGEVLALRWSAVDLDTGQVRIVASLNEDRSVKTTKTDRERLVHLDAATIAELRRWRIAQIERALAVGAALDPDPYVLSNDPQSAVPWRPDGASQRFRRLRNRAGLPTTLRLHDLRHANASVLLSAGIPMSTVSKRHGHSTIRTTVDRYGHLLDEGDRAAGEAIGDAFPG